MPLDREHEVLPGHAGAVIGDPDQPPPPPSVRTSMRRAPASSAFSTSSLTADAGRSTTSPAAMRLMTDGFELADRHGAGTFR